MELQIKRLYPNDQCTIGVLYADEAQQCFVLEDVVREQPGLDVAEWKIPKQTAIPRGRYQVVIDYSQRFGRMTPHLLEVPGFTGIRIHGGNHASDTEGCLIVGEKRIDDCTIAESAPALEDLMSIIFSALANSEQVWLTVS